MDQEVYEQARASLLDARVEWERRLDAIRADRRRESAPLDTNLDDQAIQRENDAALDALDARGRDELAAIDSALQRLSRGTFGSCVRCGTTISAERLRARPTADSCLPCAREGD